MKLLVCIAAHYAPERVKYLERVLSELNTYQCTIDIIIDSNVELPSRNANIHHLSHPFHLTQQHRQHFKRELENYDWFMYLEDDILLPWHNFLSYTEKFEMMWPNFVPSFIRIEERDGNQYISDVIEKHKVDHFIQLGENRFFKFFPFPQNYHAFWIAPQYALKETITADFTKLHDSREKAASYLTWELNKKGLIEIEKDSNGKWQIKEDCYSWHLPANYIDSGMLNGKIPVKQVFI